MELDQFIKLMSIIKTEQLRKRADQLKADGKSIDYPEENRRKLYRQGDWDAYESSIVENWEIDEELFKETIDCIAECAGISKDVMQNTLSYHGRDAAAVQKITTVESIVYDGDESDGKSSSKSKASKKSDKPKMTRSQCIENHIYVETEKFRIMAEAIETGK